MIEPAGTSWPSPTFTPRRWPTESRPFLELEPAFLWAIDQSSFFGAAGRFGAGFAASLAGVFAFAAAGFAFAAAGLGLVLERAHLVGAVGTQHGGADDGSGDERTADGRLVSVRDQQDTVEGCLLYTS